MATETKTSETEFIELKAEVRAGFAGISEQMKTIFGSLENIDHTLNGNGREGIVERVAKLEEKLTGTWRTLIILGWIANFLVAAGAMAAAFILK